jgi:hypothetical protein
MNSAPAPNWYPDPADPGRFRYWDGVRWTEHTAPATGPQLGAEPALVVSPPPPPAAVSPAGPDRGAHPTSAPGGNFPELPDRSRKGLFGSKKAVEAELSELRQIVEGFGYAEREALQADIGQLRAERDGLSASAANLRAELAALEAQVVKSREEVILQEVGVYDYHHRLEDAIAYKAQLDNIRGRIREMSKKDGGAVQGATNWTVDGSVVKGRKMVNEVSKLLLRAYNGEADVLVNKMRPYKLDAAVDRLNKARATIVRLGQTMNITIAEPFHRLRLEELRLTADFLAKKEEEKEAERAERERLREEARARKEFEDEKARLFKEQAHYATALQRMRETGTPEEIAAAEAKLAEIGDAIQGVEEREANIRAGYVYVISNFGAFGPHVVKIGMTRRLEPMDRIRELGDASVPFRYDVHALVFSEDAVSLEGRLHQTLAERRLNRVNLRREFFYATPAEVRDLLTQADGSLLEFVEAPEADEWHQSENSRRHAGVVTPGLVDVTTSVAAVEGQTTDSAAPPPPPPPTD